MGSRYGGVKQIDPVGPNGEAIIDYSVYDAIQSGFDRAVFVVRPEIEEDVRAFFAGKFDDQIKIEFVHQRLDDVPNGHATPSSRSKPWGTCHAVLAAREVIQAPFAVINGDDFYGRRAFQTMSSYLQTLPIDGTDYAMVGYRLENTLSENGSVSRGIVDHDQERWLDSIEEHTKIVRRSEGVVSLDEAGTVKRELTGREATSMNLFGFTPHAMEQFWNEFADFLTAHGSEPKSEFYIPYAMNLLKEKGQARMRVLESDARWFGVTYREDRPGVVARLRALADEGVYPASLWK